MRLTSCACPPSPQDFPGTNHRVWCGWGEGSAGEGCLSCKIIAKVVPDNNKLVPNNDRLVPNIVGQVPNNDELVPKNDQQAPNN